MYAGLHVEDDVGRGAVRTALMGWAVPPPTGAAWSCCRRGDMPTAEVTSVEWAGMEGEVDVWVHLSAGRRLIGHLIDKHDFNPLVR